MSRGNVEFMEAFLAGASRMDKAAILEALPTLVTEIADPDIEWIEDPRRADGRVYHGYAGVRESFERWLEHWDEFGYETDAFVDCGDDVLVVGREVARGAASGATVSARHYSIWTIRAGKISRYREFYEERDALDALGLDKQPSS